MPSSPPPAPAQSYKPRVLGFCLNISSFRCLCGVKNVIFSVTPRGFSLLCPLFTHRASGVHGRELGSGPWDHLLRAAQVPGTLLETEDAKTSPAQTPSWVLQLSWGQRVDTHHALMKVTSTVLIAKSNDPFQFPHFFPSLHFRPCGSPLLYSLFYSTDTYYGAGSYAMGSGTAWSLKTGSGL